MRERTIEEVMDVDEEEWGGPVQCMRSTENMEAVCRKNADKEIVVTYDSEPEKKFHTCFCEEHAAKYCKRWDAAQIFGED